MKMMIFAERNRKELMRDPLSLIFSIGLPLVLLFIMTAIRNSTGEDIFPIESFGPATAVFGQTFIAMFTGLLVSQDRGSAYLARLFASPMSAKDFILGYSLPLVPLSLMQGAICLAASAVLGLPVSVNLLWTLFMLMPSAILFIALGLLLGCLLRETQVGGVASILIQVAAFTSGMWFDVKLVGGVFLNISRILPFLHAVESARGALSGNLSSSALSVVIVLVWAAALFVAAILVFRKKMKSDQ